MINKDKIYTCLILIGDLQDREIATSYLINYSLGSSDDDRGNTRIYFNNINKNKIEKMIELNSNIKKWKWKNVKYEDWSVNWKPYFTDIKFGDKVTIIPEWNNEKQNDKLVIKIDPGMAFGTGHHETTALMIKAILKYHKKNMDVIDIGTGSGILSILTYKLQSRKILSIDNDFLVKSNFEKNMNLNNVILDLEIKDCLNIQDFNYDMILANINKKVLIDLLPLIGKIKGCAIFSGLLESDFYQLQKIIINNGYKIIDKYKKNDWIGLVLK